MMTVKCLEPVKKTNVPSALHQTTQSYYHIYSREIFQDSLIQDEEALYQHLRNSLISIYLYSVIIYIYIRYI